MLKAWEELRVPGESAEYLLLDEIQYTGDWQTWLKHQVDFNKHRRIAVTGSAIPLASEKVESGVGRWQTIQLPTLSFGEYLQIKEIAPSRLPRVRSLRDIFEWSDAKRGQTAAAAAELIPPHSSLPRLPVARRLSRNRHCSSA